MPSITETRAAEHAIAVRVGARGLTVTMSDDASPVEIPFTMDPESAVTRLSDLVGSAPERKTTEANNCSAPFTQQTWGDGLTLAYGQSGGLPGGARFDARVYGAEIAGEVRVETTAGAGVGESADAIVSATAPTLIRESASDDVPGATDTYLYYDIVNESGGESYGASLVAKSVAGGGRVVASFLAPYWVEGDC